MCDHTTQSAQRLRFLRLQAEPGSAAAAILSNDGAAHIMGNSVRAWREHYFRSISARQGQATLNAMQGLRQSLTGKPAVAQRHHIILSDSDDDIEVDLES